MRGGSRAALLLQMTAIGCALVNAGKFDGYKTCSQCVAAGYGWSLKKGKCGGYGNRKCPDPYEAEGVDPLFDAPNSLTAPLPSPPSPPPPPPPSPPPPHDEIDAWDEEEEDEWETEPEVVRFTMASAQSLMSHRLKNQLCLFVDASAATSTYEMVYAAIRDGGHSDQILGLLVPADAPENHAVLGRFFVDPKKTPAVRMAVMVPGAGGIRVMAPNGTIDSNGHLVEGYAADGKPMTAAVLQQVAKEHLEGRSQPLLRTEQNPELSHPVIMDLIGRTVDPFLRRPGSHALLLLYWSSCNHCEALMPAFEVRFYMMKQHCIFTLLTVF